MRISELFEIDKSQHELDFVDVDINSDTPLFLDPYFIAKNDFPFAYEAHLSLKSFFECLLRTLKENKMVDAKELFSHLSESNEVCLGFSKNKPQGKGMGPSDASRILQNLLESPALKSGIMEDIEDVHIFVENVGKDKISDMTANIIKKQLIDYTQMQCTIWGIHLTSDVPSGYYWDRFTNTWENRYTEMLIADNRKILLVPKRIVSFSSEFTPQKYLQHFVLNFIQHNPLQLSDHLVKAQPEGDTHHVTKASLRERYGLGNRTDKNWLAQFTEKHPEVFKDFRKKTRSKISAVSNEELSAEPIQEVCSFLIEHLKAIPSGNDDATNYHRTILGILELLFYPNLCNPSIEEEIHDGRKRIDIIFDNCAESGFFSRLNKNYCIPSQFIMVECKNYSRDVANPEIDQIAGRFSPYRGQMGIITCRSVDNMQALIERCSDTYKDSRGLIIPLIDDDLCELLKYKAEKNEKAIDDFMQNRFHMIALT